MDYAKAHGKLVGELSFLANAIKFGTFTREEIAAKIDALIGYTPPEPVADPVKAFHVKRGCCDGSNPPECHAYRVEAAKPREDRVATDRRFRNEYFGTGIND